jgi:hypothetical protein
MEHAIKFNQTGGPEVLEWTEAESPRRRGAPDPTRSGGLELYRYLSPQRAVSRVTAFRPGQRGKSANGPRGRRRARDPVPPGGDFKQRVLEITGNAGVPVVYDSVGKDTFEGAAYITYESPPWSTRPGSATV